MRSPPALALGQVESLYDDPSVRGALLPLLPEGLRSEEELRQTVRGGGSRPVAAPSLAHPTPRWPVHRGCVRGRGRCALQLRRPQVQQALVRLSQALMGDQFGSIMASLNVDSSGGAEALARRDGACARLLRGTSARSRSRGLLVAGIEAFVRALSRHEEEESGEGEAKGEGEGGAGSGSGGDKAE